ncbi:MAG: non-homologous end-joining DNA ligase [Bacteroidales bacterium]|nr:non-homologous end-joining DNA ligase [Bacteroidales bacterium]MCF8386886.1 non-homologous end-joining DNA ligase [Bacteroidales bacterium]MCF8399391.1 non-homologous end-joining DNA ligase [Bacteroidales bacterium]
MNTIFDILPQENRETLHKKDQPDWTVPMLATLTDKRFSKENWIYERKLDGERCLAFKKGQEVRLMSRNRKKKNHQYPEIEEGLKGQEHDFIIDGEIVAFDGNVTSFSKLQPRMHSKDPDMEVEVFYYVFDIIYLNGHDLSSLSLKNRKTLLKKVVHFRHDNIRYTPHRNKEGERFLEEACRKGWEGIIAKEGNSRYMHKRSKKWLKFKCENQQELVICGYTQPHGSRSHFGALIVGYYEKGKLKHAGKVGTGYDDNTLKNLHDKMKPLEQKKPPFDEDDPGYREATWLKPFLVGEFRFTEWTSDNKLRHPSFLGLRDDKKAKDVRKEKPRS